MLFCQVCKSELEEGTTTCYVCGSDLNSPEEVEWIIVGMIEDKISADYAKESLKSYNIPAIIISKSGFFGEIGLPLGTFYKSGVGLFEVSVPKDYVDEANDILNMILGEKWQRIDEN